MLYFFINKKFKFKCYLYRNYNQSTKIDTPPKLEDISLAPFSDYHQYCLSSM